MASLLVVNKRNWRLDFSWLQSLERVLQKEFKIKKEISISLLSPSEIKSLNKVYRHKNKVTDVLSFSLDEAELLGEVLICVEQAKKQAQSKKHSLNQEIKILTIHGVLHLLGYDHELSEAEYRRQTNMEAKILANISQ